MDLGISGRTALVCASSRGLGRACAMELAAAGCRVIVNGRDEAALLKTRDEIAVATGVDVVAVAGDVTWAEVRAELVAAAPQIDILVTNAGGPPARDFRQVDREAMLAGLEAQMIAPIQLIQAVIEKMAQRRFGRIVNITSGSVKMPMPGLDLSSGARAGLTGFLAGVARSVAAANVTINNLLPGAFDTDRIHSLVSGEAQRSGRSREDVRSGREAAIPARRFGHPPEFGAACAFLCSAQAGYITGQSLLIDGGAFPGIL
jgi:3-oxoacyl-[acyl-carrier protein] reductase